MTVEQFLNMNWEELNDLTTKPNEAKAKSVLNQMGNVANRRLSRLANLNLPSPAFSNRTITDKYGFAQKGSDGAFLYDPFQSTGMDDLRDVRHELKHIQSFLSSKTSTVKGAKRYAADIVKRAEGLSSIKEAEKVNWEYESSKIFWKAYNQLDESIYHHSLVHSYIGSGQTQRVARYLQENDMPFEDLYEESGRVLEDILDVRNGRYSFADLKQSWNDMEDSDKAMFGSEDRYKQIQLAEHIYVDVLERNLKIDEVD